VLRRGEAAPWLLVPVRTRVQLQLLALRPARLPARLEAQRR